MLLIYNKEKTRSEGKRRKKTRKKEIKARK
jgi:hypothetical protein